MSEEKEHIDLLQSAMMLGLWLGLYQIVKLALVPLALKFQILAFPLMLMAVGVLPFALKLVRRFRENNNLPTFPFISAWLLSLMTFLFATMLSAIAVYVYLKYMDDGFIASALMEAIEESREAYLSILSGEDAAKMGETFDQIAEILPYMTPSVAVKELVASELSWGNIFSLLIALITSRNKPYKAK